MTYVFTLPSLVCVIHEGLPDFNTEVIVFGGVEFGKLLHKLACEIMSFKIKCSDSLTLGTSHVKIKRSCWIGVNFVPIWWLRQNLS